MQTSIIATIGPKTNSVEKLTELAEAGMNIGMLTLCKSFLKLLAYVNHYPRTSPNELLPWILRVPPERH